MSVEIENIVPYRVENSVGKGEIACYKQVLLFSQCFPQLHTRAHQQFRELILYQKNTSTNIHSTSTPFQSNVPCTVCTYPTARPVPGTLDAGRHVTYPANICQRHASTPLLTLYFSPRSLFFRFGNSQKSQIAKSGLYGGCGSISISSSLMVPNTTRLLWLGALSWCSRIPDLISCGRFLLIASSRSDLITDA